MMRRSILLALTLALATAGCGGPQILTEKRMLEWGPILNLYMGTNMEGGNSYPKTLDELPPELSADLERTDGWGNPLLYRLLRIDKYNLISGGPDGEFGNEDDILLENGALYEPMTIYAKHPIKS